VIAYVGPTTNDLRETRNETQYLAANLFGEYENTFNDTHYLKVLIGYNYEQSTWQRIRVQRNGLIFEDATDINLALGQSMTTEGGWDRWNILGGFGRINYSFKDRYLVEINGRYDGSSKFPSTQRYAFFPSYSAGWRISKESFWNVSPKIISDLKHIPGKVIDNTVRQNSQRSETAVHQKSQCSSRRSYMGNSNNPEHRN
jgi:hypothetical protein